jgi:hypothetical protein
MCRFFPLSKKVGDPVKTFIATLSVLALAAAAYAGEPQKLSPLQAPQQQQQAPPLRLSQPQSYDAPPATVYTAPQTVATPVYYAQPTYRTVTTPVTTLQPVTTTTMVPVTTLQTTTVADSPVLLSAPVQTVGCARGCLLHRHRSKSVTATRTVIRS